MRKIFIFLLTIGAAFSAKPHNTLYQLWCSSCKAIVTEMLFILGESRSEMDVD